MHCTLLQTMAWQRVWIAGMNWVLISKFRARLFADRIKVQTWQWHDEENSRKKVHSLSHSCVALRVYVQTLSCDSLRLQRLRCVLVAATLGAGTSASGGNDAEAAKALQVAGVCLCV